ncbi:hypothetical protein [Actinoplanes sp. NPDC051859]|uniref:hypothetical protein n=1 Tax=Actinoplanes sp. NPDC051859 TaxID=3363909 RepID=UPI0037AC18AC
MPDQVNVDPQAMARLGEHIAKMAKVADQYGTRADDIYARFVQGVGNEGKGDDITAELVKSLVRIKKAAKYLHDLNKLGDNQSDGTIGAAKRFDRTDQENAEAATTFSNSLGRR